MQVKNSFKLGEALKKEKAPKKKKAPAKKEAGEKKASGESCREDLCLSSAGLSLLDSALF